MGAKQFSSAREQLMGQIAMAEERNISFMIMMAKSLLDHDRIESLEEVFSKIDRIEATDIMDVANEIFQEKELSILTYLPN